jgi:hypothetical protein
MKKVHPVAIIIPIAVILMNIIMYIDRAKQEKEYQLFFPKDRQTEELKIILEQSRSDRSLENIKAIAESNSDFKVDSIVLSKPYTSFGVDRIALRVNDTILLFKDGIFSFEIKPDKSITNNNSNSGDSLLN